MLRKKRKTIITAAALVSIALVAGCGPTREELELGWHSKCQGYGFKQGTEGYAHCLMNQEMAYRRAVSEAMSQVSRDMDRLNQPGSYTNPVYVAPAW